MEEDSLNNRDEDLVSWFERVLRDGGGQPFVLGQAMYGWGNIEFDVDLSVEGVITVNYVAQFPQELRCSICGKREWVNTPAEFEEFINHELPENSPSNQAEI